MNDYAPNSHRAKEETPAVQQDKKIEKVVTGKARTQKKSGLHTLSDTIFSDDIHKVKNYVLLDVLVPAIKKAISDIVVNGIDMMLYGETGHTSKNNRSGRVSYNGCYTNSRDDRGSSRDTRARPGYDYGEVIVDTKGEAEQVLDRMDEIIKEYGTVSVADLYDLCDITGNYTDNKYGWSNINGAESVRCHDGGYMLKLPKALPLA